MHIVNIGAMEAQFYRTMKTGRHARPGGTRADLMDDQPGTAETAEEQCRIAVPPTLRRHASVPARSRRTPILAAAPQERRRGHRPARTSRHGMCTYGFAVRAILEATCDYDPTRLKRLGARISAPVFPGDLLRTEIWTDGAVVSFRTTVPARGDVIVLNNGVAEVS